MSLEKIDLNLLVYLDMLLRERNVTRAAQHLGITQPALSNGLARLRELFGDPLLVRTSQGMMPTEKAQSLQPHVTEVLSKIEQFTHVSDDFKAAKSDRLFRVMASDYAETTLLPSVRAHIREVAPDVRLDILTPSDITFADLERGKVDLVINRFDDIPQSLHLVTLWEDSFSCVMHKDNPLAQHLDLERYLRGNHVWVSKTGMGKGTGVNPDDIKQLGWVDIALDKLGHRRHIVVFTRHYISAMQLAQQDDLIATMATRSTRLVETHPDLIVLPAPFPIPRVPLHLVWSPLLHHNASHKWFRNVIKSVAKTISAMPVDE